jgi:DNA-binding MarR family transcriptional regulator
VAEAAAMSRPFRHNPLGLLLYEVLRLRSQIIEAFANTGKFSGLSGVERTVLTAVAESGSPLTVPQIGRNVGLHRQVVNRASTHLIDIGLLRSASNPRHKRANLLQITSEGIELYRRIVVEAEIATAPLLASLGQEYCEKTARQIREFRIRLESESSTD